MHEEQLRVAASVPGASLPQIQGEQNDNAQDGFLLPAGQCLNASSAILRSVLHPSQSNTALSSPTDQLIRLILPQDHLLHRSLPLYLQQDPHHPQIFPHHLTHHELWVFVGLLPQDHHQHYDHAQYQPHLPVHRVFAIRNGRKTNP